MHPRFTVSDTGVERISVLPLLPFKRVYERF